MSRGELRAARWVAPQRHPLTKVPEVTAYFWITKVLTTGMGEATSDYLVHRFNPEIAVVAGFTAFVAAMALQFSVRRYNSWVYWLAVVMVAVFGAFAISGDRVLEMFGLAMASAVLLDALVVRMLLLPAVLQLLGRTTWALPRWLDGRLPRVAIEAEPSPKPRPALEPALEAGS